MDLKIIINYSSLDVVIKIMKVLQPSLIKALTREESYSEYILVHYARSAIVNNLYFQAHSNGIIWRLYILFGSDFLY